MGESVAEGTVTKWMKKVGDRVERDELYLTGTAEVVRGSGNFQLTVRLRGLPPSSKHIAHIHVGSCAANGAIDVPLQPLVADGAGSATSITTVNMDYVIPPAGWYANVHQGPDLQGDNAKPMACGDLKAA